MSHNLEWGESRMQLHPAVNSILPRRYRVLRVVFAFLAVAWFVAMTIVAYVEEGSGEWRSAVWTCFAEWRWLSGILVVLVGARLVMGSLLQQELALRLVRQMSTRCWNGSPTATTAHFQRVGLPESVQHFNSTVRVCIDGQQVDMVVLLASRELARAIFREGEIRTQGSLWLHEDGAVCVVAVPQGSAILAKEHRPGFKYLYWS